MTKIFKVVLETKLINNHKRSTELMIAGADEDAVRKAVEESNFPNTKITSITFDGYM